MTYEEAVKAINTNYRRVLKSGQCCEGYEVRQMQKALAVLEEELKKAVKIKFGE